MKTAVIYARVSSTTDRQDTGRQVTELRKFARGNDYKVIKVFEEQASGVTDRPIEENCIAFCKAMHVSTILVSEMSRLGRDAFNIMTILNDLIHFGIDVYFHKERFFLLTNDGKPNVFTPIIISVLATCAQLEREDIKYRLNSGRRIYIERGGKLGRRKGSVKTKEAKEIQYKDVLHFLRKGYGTKEISRLTGVSTSTIQRLRKEFDLPLVKTTVLAY